MTKSRRRWLCLDCKRDTSQLREHYFLKGEIWSRVHSSAIGMLCIGCVETRLGRKLTASDFTDAHINDPKRYEMSDRLRSRLAS